MKVDSKNYKGIEYIQVNELPLAQREKLLQTISPDLFIKIMIDGKIVSQCLQYKDYTFWFNNYFSKAFIVKEKVVAETVEVKANLSFQ